MLANTSLDVASELEAASLLSYDDEAYLHKRTVSVRSSLALSPDGQWIALVTQGLATGEDAGDKREEAKPLEAMSEELVGSEVLLIHTQTGEVLRPFQSFQASFAPAWSPNGEFLALLCQDGVRRFPRVTLWRRGEEPRVFEAAPMSPLTGFVVLRWSADSTRLILKVNALPDAEPLVKRQTTETVGVELKSRESLAVLDVRTGQVQVWGEMTHACGWHLSPDGSKVAFARAVMSPLSARHNQASYRQLVVASLDDGEEKILGEAQTDNWGASFSWSPDGDAIAWVCAAHQSPTQLFVADLNAPEPLCPVDLPAGTEFGWFDVGWYPSPAPLWRSDSEFALPGEGKLWRFSRDGHVLDTFPLPEEKGFDWLCNSVTALDFASSSSAPRGEPTGRDVWLLRPNQVWKADLETGEVVPVWQKKPETPNVSSGWIERAFDPAAGELYTAYWTPNGTITLWATHLTSADNRCVALVSEGIGQIQTGEVRHLTWTLPDSTPCGGSLLLPVGWKEDDRPPLVMNVYGDDRNNGNLDASRFHDAGYVVDLHLLSAQGYAVFIPDLPQTEAEPAGSLVVAGEAAVEALRGSGLVDVERIALIGNSYGGYTTLCLLVGSRLFCAGVASNGVYDLAFMATHGGWGWAEAGQGLMRATLWENPERYRQNSPLYKLDHLDAPLLILQGGDDVTVGDAGKPLFAALQRLGKRGELLTYRAAGHAPTFWSIRAQRDWHGRLLAFLHEHLQPVGQS